MRNVAFVQRPQGAVKKGATQAPGEKTSESQETGPQGKKLTGSQKSKEFGTT